ncbi:hypothetical protein CMV_002236 [Castanea mollissima]|uniref:Uncharacterized protein n=1 Tax=Castanea mollissima TaxID=60419 RepID=A0A8J4RX11_9ROSI|nr:hypothetical protein CMV_002236 [Castanea mollissima]
MLNSIASLICDMWFMLHVYYQRKAHLYWLCIVCYLLIFKDQTIPKCCQLKMQTYLLLPLSCARLKLYGALLK